MIYDIECDKIGWIGVVTRQWLMERFPTVTANLLDETEIVYVNDRKYLEPSEKLANILYSGKKGSIPYKN